VAAENAMTETVAPATMTAAKAAASQNNDSEHTPLYMRSGSAPTAEPSAAESPAPATALASKGSKPSQDESTTDASNPTVEPESVDVTVSAPVPPSPAGKADQPLLKQSVETSAVPVVSDIPKRNGGCCIVM
jgi:hypothetical protein